MSTVHLTYFFFLYIIQIMYEWKGRYQLDWHPILPLYKSIALFCISYILYTISIILYIAFLLSVHRFTYFYIFVYYVHILNPLYRSLIRYYHANKVLREGFRRIHCQRVIFFIIMWSYFRRVAAAGVQSVSGPTSNIASLCVFYNALCWWMCRGISGRSVSIAEGHTMWDI